MKTTREPARKLPALILSVLLAMAGPQALLAGGRDVPDQKKSSSNTETSQSPDSSGPLGSCTDQTVTTTTVGGLELEVTVTSDGDVSVRPALWAAASRWLGRLLGSGDGSCLSP